MRTLKEVNKRLSELAQQLAPLNREVAELNREKETLESLAFIEANKIKLGDIQFSTAEGLPWFGDCWSFARWIRTHTAKPWAEWNGRIHRTSDLICGRMTEAPGIAAHIAE